MTVYTQLNLREKVAQMLICGMEGVAVNEPAKELAQKLKVGGIIFYKKNTPTALDTLNLANALQEAVGDSAPPLFIAIDEEHGRVSRINEGITHFVDMASVGRLGDLAIAKKIAAITTMELKACGINLNFAPVCDVNVNRNNEVIGNRSFSDNPSIVSKMASAYIKEGARLGMILCAKHFPGHGDTTVDSHLDLPVVKKSLEELEKCELAPFKAAIKAGAQTVMTAHILFPAIDALPATMSRKIITDILIKKLKFKGVVISDDMQMGAIAKNYGVTSAVIQSIKSGVNMFIISGMQKPDINIGALIESIVKAVSDGAIKEEAIDLSATKILRLKNAYITKRHFDPKESAKILRQEDSLKFAEYLLLRSNVS